MEDCTESHQSDINRKIKGNGKLRNFHTSMPNKTQSAHFTETVLSRKCDRWTTRRQLSWSRTMSERKTENLLGANLERYREGTASTSGDLAEIDRDRPGFGVCQCQTDSNRAGNGVFGSRASSGQAPYQTKRHNKPSSRCSSLFSRCKAKVATVCRNCSWRLERRKKMSRKSARLWHTQCVSWKQRPRLPSLAQRRAGTRATTSSLLGKHAWLLQHGHREPGSHQEKPLKCAHRKETFGKEM